MQPPDGRKTQPLILAIAIALGTYTVAYGVIRATALHRVEHYPQGKGGDRQDYITKRDQPPGTGWEYQLFRPAIAIEEALIRAFTPSHRRP
ncbi:MAG: hypothetical protein Fur0042_25760 [Cyanophyceae cyanobacterium]